MLNFRSPVSLKVFSWQIIWDIRLIRIVVLISLHKFKSLLLCPDLMHSKDSPILLVPLNLPQLLNLELYESPLMLLYLLLLLTLVTRGKEECESSLLLLIWWCLLLILLMKLIFIILLLN